MLPSLLRQDVDYRLYGRPVSSPKPSPTLYSLPLTFKPMEFHIVLLELSVAL